MTRTFGVEIEMFSNRPEQDMNWLAGLLRNEFGTSEPVIVGRFNTPCGEYWLVKGDGSIRNTGNGIGMELVSPKGRLVLKGEDGLRRIARVAEILEQAGMRVNTTTGLHVHVGACDMTVEEVKNVIRRYAKHQDEIDAVLPESRRAPAQSAPGVRCYTQPIRKIADRIVRANVNDLGSLIRYQDERYYSVNLHSLYKHGTIEIRHHSGTVDPKKITNWVRFVLNFIETSKRLANPSGAAPSMKEPKANSKSGVILKGIREGKRVAQIASELGWGEPGVIWNVRCITKKYGIQFELVGTRTDGEGRMFREVRTAPVAPEDNSAFEGCPEDVKTFYKDRAARLAR